MENKEEELIQKLEKWVQEHPDEAKVSHINLTTQKEFTIEGILHQLVEAKRTDSAILDKDTLDVKEQIGKWIGGL